ncbi:alpha/beta hydrolase [Dysgonomonas sp. 521]|uniref:alpha/beta hydrolase n=1 Tax=Dysgonomonas sp. 521 TaxID=2302932 RepID=UPI0013D7F67F|nr:alpha/beta fold hydrolase [Dysgonomonas sp. 521]
MKISISAVLIALILINAATFIQAYKLTHFSESAKPIMPGHEPSFAEMVKVAVCGLDVPRPKTKAYPDRSYETIQIRSDSDKVLEGWLLRTDSLKHGMAIAFHGYMDEKSSMLDRAYPLLDMGYDVLLVDFMGAGGSYGSQSTIGYLEAGNVKASYDYATTTLKEDKIVLIGFSMGAVAIMKAQYDYDMPVRGVILEAAYGTFKGTVDKRLDRFGLPRWPASSLFTFWTGIINGFDAFKANPQDFGKKIYVPALVMCGGNDPNIPQEETQLIFDQLASKCKELVFYPESRHETYLLKYPDKWKSTVQQFLHEIELRDIHHE